MFTVFRRILASFLVVALGVFACAGTAGATSAAKQSAVDVAVGLDAFGSLMLAGAGYTVSVTNNGPQALVHATVVVRLDPRVLGDPPTPSCPYDAASHTLTCSFGALAVGATASLTTWVYFSFPLTSVDFDATATLATSTPVDVNAANDSDTVRCHYNWRLGIPINPWPPLTYC